MAIETTETIEPVTEEPTEAPAGFDIEAASDQIGASLFPQADDAPAQEALPLADQVPAAAAKEPVPVVPEVPKSWAKDYHEAWAKVEPKVQDYIKKREKDFLDGLEQYKGAAQYGKSLQDVLAPYHATIQAQGLDAPRAVQTLLQAHTRLTTGTLESRQAAYAELGRNLQLTPPDLAASNGTPIDPRIQTLEQQLGQIQQSLTAQQQTALETARQKAGQEVAAFASDPQHALFDECYEDIVKFIQAGDSLQEAYDRAVWANPVTREKQVQARLQTETEKARETARLNALPKTRAKSVNVNSRETQRAPTEPLGSMEDTMKATLASIKSRTTH